MSEITLTTDNFQNEVLQSTEPVLVDFWAPWCAPCRMIAPYIAEIAKEYEGRLKVGKVNIEKETSLAEQHEIVSIPCLKVYKDGKIVKKQVGAMPKKMIEELIENVL